MRQDKITGRAAYYVAQMSDFLFIENSLFGDDDNELFLNALLGCQKM